MESLYHARKSLTGPVIISYGDVVYTKDAVEKILNYKSDGITIGYDSSFNKEPFKLGEVRKNLIKINGELIEEIGYLPVNSQISGEFVGVVHSNPETTRLIKNFLKNDYIKARRKPFIQAKEIEYAFLTDLLTYLMSKEVPIYGVDIGKTGQK